MDNYHNAHGRLRKRLHQVVENTESKLKKGAHKVGDFVKHGKAVHLLAKISTPTILIRAAFISVLDMNLVGITSALGLVKDKKGKHWEDILQKWWLMGGEKKNFNHFVDKHRNQKHLFEHLFNKKKHNATGEDSLGDKVGKAAAFLGSAATVLTAAGQPAIAAYPATSAAVLAVFAPTLKAFAKENGASPDTLAQLDNATKNLPNPLVGKGVLNPDGSPITTETGEMSDGTKAGIAIGILAALIIIGVIIKSKK